MTKTKVQLFVELIDKLEVGEKLSKTSIMDSVWGENEFPSTNTMNATFTKAKKNLPNKVFYGGKNFCIIRTR